MIRKIETGRFVVYNGPDLPNLKRCETVMINTPYHIDGKVWVTNMNMPLYGTFTGNIEPKYLEPLV
jgi:hypothetical protein